MAGRAAALGIMGFFFPSYLTAQRAASRDCRPVLLYIGLWVWIPADQGIDGNPDQFSTEGLA